MLPAPADLLALPVLPVLPALPVLTGLPELAVLPELATPAAFADFIFPPGPAAPDLAAAREVLSPHPPPCRAGRAENYKGSSLPKVTQRARKQSIPIAGPIVNPIVNSHSSKSYKGNI